MDTYNNTLMSFAVIIKYSYFHWHSLVLDWINGDSDSLIFIEMKVRRKL